MKLVSSIILFVFLLILSIFFSVQKKYKTALYLVLFSFLQGFLFSFIYAEIKNIHLFNAIVIVPLFSGLYYLIMKQLPYLLIASKFGKFEKYEDKYLIKWLNKVEILKDGEIILKKYPGEYSFNAFLIKIPFSRKIRIAFGQKLIDKLNEKEKIIVIAHEIGHYVKKHFLCMYVLFVALAILVTFIFGLMGEFILLKLNFGAEIRTMLFFILSFLFFIIVVSIFNSISSYIECDADRYAVSITRDYESFKNMLFKLDKEKPMKNYGRLINLFLYDHPPVDVRIEKAKYIQVN